MSHSTATLRSLYVNVGGKTDIHIDRDTRDYDMICFAETHRGEGDAPYTTVPGFTAYECNRAAGKKGGMAVLMNNSSKLVGTGTGVKVRSDPSAGIVWVEAGTSCLLVAVCYFSPKGSRLYSQGILHPDPLQQLFGGIVDGQSRGLKCIIMGDMNIRVGRRCHDVPVCTGSDSGPPTLQQVQQEFRTLYTEVPRTRESHDHEFHSDWGNRLMHGLQAAGIVLLNGRAPGDEQGRFTYHQPPGRGTGRQGHSAIDLCCVSAEWYRHVRRFQVSDFDLSMSSDHSMIEVHMELPCMYTPRANRTRVCRPVGHDAVQAYRANLQTVDHVFASIWEDMQQGRLSLASAVSAISSVLELCCRQPDQPRQRRGHSDSAPWFDEECAGPCERFRAAYAAYLRHRQALGGIVPQDDPVFVASREARTAYKRVVRRKRREYAKQRQLDHLDAYFSRHSRDFWQAFKDNKHPPCPVTDPAEWTSHFMQLFGTEPAPLQFTEEQVTMLQRLHDRHVVHPTESELDTLNRDFTVDDIEIAMHMLPRRKAADAHGLTCELLKAAVCAENEDSDGESDQGDEPGVVAPHLVACLAHILQHLPSTAEYPEHMAVGKLAPVPKKGTIPTDRTTYRGICISSVFSQLHDRMLTSRADHWVESKQLRAITQCGFRKEHGTLDALFVMHHMHNKYKHLRKPIYLCYVDFKKAFDMVRRDAMINRAKQLGMHGKFLAALQQIFDNISLAVCVNGVRGEQFKTYKGTKQGSTLSPLCFGIFIEQLHELITMQLPGAGPLVDGMRVPDIMYADDVKLIATSCPAELQHLLDVLHLFCTLFDMEVNLSPQKTCILVLRRAGSSVPAGLKWYYNGQEVPVCDQYTDLGCLYHDTKGIKTAADALAAPARRAMHGMLTKCRKEHIVQPDFKLRLFDTVVEPVMSYGCQVWGPDMFYGKLHAPMESAADRLQLDYIRIMAGVGRQVERYILLAEYGRYPIMWHWIALATRWWVRLTGMNADRLAYRAFKDDIRLMLDGCKDCWTFKLLDTLTHMGIVQASQWKPNNGSQVTVDTILQLCISETAVVDALQSLFDSTWNSEPAHGPREALCPSQQIMHATYNSWIRDGANIPTYMKSHGLSFCMVQCISRYRLGWHKLAIQTGRHNGTPRMDRVCQMCKVLGHKDDDGNEPVEDAMHFLLECRALDLVRDKYPALHHPAVLPGSSKEVHMKFIMNYRDPVMLAQCLLDMQERREQCLTLLDTPDGVTQMVEQMAGYIPVDHNIQRHLAAEASYDDI